MFLGTGHGAHVGPDGDTRSGPEEVAYGGGQATVGRSVPVEHAGGVALYVVIGRVGQHHGIGPPDGFGQAVHVGGGGEEHGGCGYFGLPLLKEGSPPSPRFAGRHAYHHAAVAFQPPGQFAAGGSVGSGGQREGDSPGIAFQLAYERFGLLGAAHDDDGHGAGFGSQRQQVAPVGQHGDGGLAQGGGQLSRGGRTDALVEARELHAGLAGQPEGVLPCQHAAAMVVHLGLCQFAVVDGFHQRVHLFLDAAGHKQHVAPSLQCLQAQRAGSAHALHGQRVGEHKSAEAQVLAQQPRHYGVGE